MVYKPRLGISTLLEFFPNQAAPRLLQAMQPTPTVPPWVSERLPSTMACPVNVLHMGVSVGHGGHYTTTFRGS